MTLCVAGQTSNYWISALLTVTLLSSGVSGPYLTCEVEFKHFSISFCSHSTSPLCGVPMGSHLIKCGYFLLVSYLMSI